MLFVELSLEGKLYLSGQIDAKLRRLLPIPWPHTLFGQDTGCRFR